MQRFICLLGLLLSSLCLSSQVEFTCEAPEEANVGEPFKIAFVLTNAEGKDVKFPKFEGFQVLKGPGISNSTSIINGSISSTMGYTFTLLAEEKGMKMIGIASIVVGNKTYYSGGKKINVITPQQMQGGGEKSEFAIIPKAEASKTNLYVGEQFIMKYKLYYGEQLGITDRPTVPAFKNFFNKRLEVDEEKIPGVKVGNRMYNGVLFDVYSLFPQTEGEKEIPAAIYHLEKRGDNRDPFNPFGGVIQKSVQTNTVKLKIKPLPAYDKKDFSGVVGKYSIEGSVLQNDISTDQSTTIKLKIKGNGDAMQLTPPKLELDPSLEVFPPKLINSTESFNGTYLEHVSDYEYIIKPKKDGKYKINASLVYFEPSTGQYTSASKELGEVTVTQGSKKTFDQFYTGGESQSNNSSRYWILLGSLLLGGFIYFYKKPKKNSTTASESKLSEKYLSKAELLQQKASAKLAKAKALMANEESQSFYKEVESSINQVVQEKFSLSNEEFTKQRLKEIIDEHYNNSEMGNDYLAIFTKVDMARYGGNANQNMQEIYKKAEQFIKDLEP
jgi:hypothetical protein